MVGRMGDEAVAQRPQRLFHAGAQVITRPLSLNRRLLAPLFQPAPRDLAILGKKAAGVQDQP